jgi:uncharacterized protein
VRVFLDTNVLVSAFAARGLCADVLRHVLAEHELIVGEVVLQEFRSVLRQKLGLPVSIIEDAERFLRQYELVPKPAAPSDIPVRDPDDTWVLASAIEGKAEVLVTDDQDLLVVAEEAPLRIVDPREFWSLIRAHRATTRRTPNWQSAGRERRALHRIRRRGSRPGRVHGRNRGRIRLPRSNS